MDSYTVSAIVLVYNGGKYLKTCINSLVNQTLNNTEIILVNDASTDNSLDVCEEFAKKYDNIKIINKKENKGLGNSANMGIEYASGEYVILIDNDDYIPPCAFEKMYNKAKKTNSDVVTGKPNFLGKYQYEVVNFERNIWIKERNIKNIKEYPLIFGECYYWNKIVKKQLLLENNITLNESTIYADVGYSSAVFSYANNISMIPDTVYIWRQRWSLNDQSLSKKTPIVENYLDRINIYENNIAFVSSIYPDYFKLVARRIMLPIKDILTDEKFKEVFLDKSREIITREVPKCNDFFDNNLDLIHNLYIYMILNNLDEELVKLLNTDLKLEKNIVYEEDKAYWDIEWFRNLEIDIPDELFQIKFLDKTFINIEKIIIKNKNILFENITIPDNFEIFEGFIIFRKTVGIREILDEHTYRFKLKNSGSKNIFSVDVPINKLKPGTFEILVDFKYGDRLDRIGIDKANYKEIINKNKNIKYRNKRGKLNISLPKKLFYSNKQKIKNKIKKIINFKL